jgi:hypothetical protein
MHDYNIAGRVGRPARDDCISGMLEAKCVDWIFGEWSKSSWKATSHCPTDMATGKSQTKTKSERSTERRLAGLSLL